MEVGLLIRWGGAIEGREAEQLRNYRRAVDYGRRLLAEGKLTSFEPFAFAGGDVEVEQGFFIVKGSAPDIFAILESEEYQELYATATLTAKHVSTEMLAVGEGIEQRIAVYERALASAHV